MEAVITTIIGLLGGFILSALFWYVTVHIIGPSLEFSEQISRITDSTGATVYRVKIRNSNRRRGIIDVTFKISIRFPTQAIDPLARSSSITSFAVKTRNMSMFRLAPQRAQLIDMDLAKTLIGDSATDLIYSLYPIEMQREGLDFEALLSRSSGANLRVHIFCYDQWSGARKYFESKKYEASDIKEGRFDGMVIN